MSVPQLSESEMTQRKTRGLRRGFFMTQPHRRAAPRRKSNPVIYEKTRALRHGFVGREQRGGQA